MARTAGVDLISAPFPPYRCSGMEICLKIGIIGAGKVGTTLGKYLSQHGIEVSGFFSRTQESADEAATFTETAAYQSMEGLVKVSDVIFVATPDGAVAEVWQRLRAYDLCGYVICHFSGSLSSHVFSKIDGTGAYGLSVHPMYAFSDKFQSYQNFQKAYITMEGDDEAVAVMKPLWEGLGHPVMMVRAADKMKYHAAAAMASNEMLGLMQTSIDLLVQCGFDEAAAMTLLTPLIRSNMETMLEEGCVRALTGPVERGDMETVRGHLKALSGSGAEEVYRSLGSKVTELAQAKNPERDYRAMRKIFEKKDI